MIRKTENTLNKRFKRAQRQLRSAILWSSLLILMSLVVIVGILLIIGGAIPDPFPTPPPAPKPTPTPHLEARIELEDGKLAAGGSEVRRGLTITNTGNTTGTLHLKLDGHLPLETIHLFPSRNNNGNPLSWQPPRSIDLGVFPPGEKKRYQLVTYRRAPSYDVEPPFLLQLRNVSGDLIDEAFVVPNESVPEILISATTPDPLVQKQGAKVPISIEGNLVNYELKCFDSTNQNIHSDIIRPSQPLTPSCPIESGEPGTWSVKIYPSLSPDHPDTMQKPSPWVTETFEIHSADYTLGISNMGSDTSQQGLATWRYEMTNNGNIAYDVDVEYEPITHALTTTLTVTSTTGTLLHTLTFTGAEESRSLLPPEVSLEPAQNVFLEAEVLYDGLPLEFILELIPGSDQNHAISRREFIEQ